MAGADGIKTYGHERCLWMSCLCSTRVTGEVEVVVDQADGIRVLSAVEAALPLPVSESVKVGPGFRAPGAKKIVAGVLREEQSCRILGFSQFLVDPRGAGQAGGAARGAAAAAPGAGPESM